MSNQEQASSEFLLDRSRLEQYQRCPRKFYWGYAYKGLGVVQNKKPLPLAFGGATHLGLQRILEQQPIESAVGDAIAEFEQVARSQGLELSPNEDAFAVFNEQRALLEALLRAWYIVRFPSFMEEYEILDLEREEEWSPSPGITFMARADGVLRQRADQSLYILSFKTTKAWSRYRDSEARTDIQGISELVAVEQRYGERVQGIQMEYLVKGARSEWPKGSGIYQTASPLIRPWVNADGKYAHSWAWEDMDGRHTLGNKWRKVAIWETMPIAEWIGYLASGQCQPEVASSCLDSYIISPLPYLRNRDEIESWKRQAEQQAVELQAKSASVEVSRQDPTAFITTLDCLMPQYRHSCNYPTRCPYQDICFGPAGPEPEQSGLYQFREPHHEKEAERCLVTTAETNQIM